MNSYSYPSNMLRDIRGVRTIGVGDLVQQLLWDSGDPIPKERLPVPRRVEKTHIYLVWVTGASDWQAASQFEKVGT